MSPSIAFNRTSVELKQKLGIESTRELWTFNRTSVELKHAIDGQGFNKIDTFNRTSVELKRARLTERTAP